MRWVASALVATMLACGQIAAGNGDASPDGSSVDAGPRCDPTRPFGTPVPLTEVDTPAYESSFRLTPDELTAVFVRSGSGDPGMPNSIFITTRPSIGAPFAPATKVPLVLPAQAPELTIENASITADGLSIFFECAIVGQQPAMGLVTRPTTADAFGPITLMGYPCQNLMGTGPGAPACDVFVSGDGHRAYMMTFVDPNMGRTLYVAEHPTPSSDFVLGSALLPKSTLLWPVVTSDEHTLLVAGPADGGGSQIETATRTTTTDAFGALAPVEGMGAPNEDAPTWVSPDACRLYFTRLGPQDSDVYVAARQP